MVAEKDAQLSPPLAQHQQQIAGLLGDPGPVGIGGHPGQVDSPSADLNEEQHVQPSQPNGVDGEQVAGDDPGGLLAQECLPRGGCRPRGRVQSVATQRRADRGGRDADPEALKVALDRW
jgi:hypothetical protein